MCKNFPKISFSDLVEKVKNNEIKEFFLGYSSTFQVITTKGKKYIIQVREKDTYDVGCEVTRGRVIGPKLLKERLQ